MDPLGIDHAIDEVNSKTIPLLEQTIQRQMDRLPQLIGDQINLLVSQESNIVTGVIQSAVGMLDRIEEISKRYEALAARLDGATVTLALKR